MKISFYLRFSSSSMFRARKVSHSSFWSSLFTGYENFRDYFHADCRRGYRTCVWGWFDQSNSFFPFSHHKIEHIFFSHCYFPVAWSPFVCIVVSICRVECLSFVHRTQVQRKILQCIIPRWRARLPRISYNVEHESLAVVAHRHQLAPQALFGLLLLQQGESFPETAPPI